MQCYGLMELSTWPLAMAVLLQLSSTPCMGVNFTTVPLPDGRNTLSFCSNGDGSSGIAIQAFCSWTMGSLVILPRVDIGLPNGDNVSLAVGDIRLPIYGIQTGNISTTGGIHTLPLLIISSSAINGSAIGCSEGGLSSTKTTFIARYCVNESSITYASMATTILPTQPVTLLPMTTMEPTMSSAPTPSSLTVGLVVAIIFVVIMAFPIVSGVIIADRKYGCISRKRTTKRSEGNEKLHPHNKDGPEHVFYPVHDCPDPQPYTPVSIPLDDSEILPDSILERVPGDPLHERIGSGNETMPRNRGGSSYSSLHMHDCGPPDYYEIIRPSTLQPSDPSIWEPEHLCESGTLNIGFRDSQISAGQRQEVPVMPEGRPLSPSPFKIAIPEQLRQSCFILGDIHIISLTHLGGTFPLYPFGPLKGAGKYQLECCATLEAPPGVVERGVSLYVHYAIILDGPFKLPKNWKRASVVLHIDCPDNHLMLEPVKLSLHHWAVVGSCNSMSFMKSHHFFGGGQNAFKFKQHTCFIPSEAQTASLNLKDHFCLVCIAAKEFERYKGMSRYYGMLLSDPLKDSMHKFFLCLTYAVPSWIEVVALYFRKKSDTKRTSADEDFDIPEYQELELDCNDKVTLEIQRESGPGWAVSITKKEVL